MDIGTGITAIIFLALCLGIYWLLTRKNAQMEQHMLRLLKNEAEKNNAKLVHHDTWHNCAIGLDNKSRVIFATRKSTNETPSSCTSLSNVNECKTRITHGESTLAGDNFKNVKQVELLLSTSSKITPELRMEFYNESPLTPSLTGELQLVEKWSALINKELGKISRK
jgi:hypothetical protein